MTSNSNITVGIKTFLRPDKLKRCLEHVEDLDPGANEVIVADDSPKRELNEDVYARFREKIPLKVLEMEPDSGLAAGRNRILEETDTEYLLIIDDDHYLPPEMLQLESVLDADRSLGGISASLVEDGSRKIIAGDIQIRNGWIIIDVFDQKKTEEAAGFDYIPYDFVPNNVLFRSEALRDYRWDETYVIDGEHEDFYLGHKTQTNWDFAITPDVWAEHDPGPGLLEEYQTDHRMNEAKRKKSREYFVEKWGVKGYLFRGYHHKDFENHLSDFGARVLYALPPRIQWEIKKRGYLDSIKFTLEDLA